jgi:hypothetical protein
MSWDWIAPTVLAVAFVLVWIWVLPRLGVRT